MLAVHQTKINFYHDVSIEPSYNNVVAPNHLTLKPLIAFDHTLFCDYGQFFSATIIGISIIYFESLVVTPLFHSCLHRGDLSVFVFLQILARILFSCVVARALMRNSCLQLNPNLCSSRMFVVKPRFGV